MSPSDRRFLSIMRLFEAEKRTSLSAFFSRWCPSLDATVSDPLPRLPTFTTLILLHALRGVFYPSNFIYPRTASFLLPELDVSDVPILSGMLDSNSQDWKKERGWMLEVLGDGMGSTDD